MESIEITTGQNVIIRYQTATLLQRTAARLLDYIFMFTYLFSTYYLFLKILSTQLVTYPSGLVIAMLVFWLPALGYHFIFESLCGGKTPGKMIVKIKVTNIDGSIPGIGAYFLRWLLYLVDQLFGGSVGAVFILFTKNHQRLGDMAAGTIVVKTNPALAFGLDESYYVFPDNYEPTFIQVDRLSAGQIALITNLLIEPKSKIAISGSISDLAHKVKAILNIESTLDNREFLETIVKDYNYYASLEI
jgi:uncharacterized RDD family membrane protein YckC